MPNKELICQIVQKINGRPKFLYDKSEILPSTIKGSYAMHLSTSLNFACSV